MFILKNIANVNWNLEKGLSNFIGRVIQLPSMLNFPISVVKCFQHSLPKLVSAFVNCPNYILNFHQFNFPMTLYVLFCTDFMAR